MDYGFNQVGYKETTEEDTALTPYKMRGVNGFIYNTVTYDVDTTKRINGVAGLRLLSHPPVNRDAQPRHVTFKTTLIFNATKWDGEKALMDDNQAIYLGAFQNSVPNGKGALILSDGSTYEGKWINGEAHGFISITLPYGFTGMGEWRYGIPDYNTLTITRPNRSTARVSEADIKGMGLFLG